MLLGQESGVELNLHGGSGLPDVVALVKHREVTRHLMPIQRQVGGVYDLGLCRSRSKLRTLDLEQNQSHHRTREIGKKPLGCDELTKRYLGHLVHRESHTTGMQRDEHTGL